MWPLNFCRYVARCSVLQRVAVCCNVVRCVAVLLRVLQRRGSCHAAPLFQEVYSGLPRVAACCSVLQCVAVCCSASQYVATRCSVLQYVPMYRNVMQGSPCYLISNNENQSWKFHSPSHKNQSSSVSICTASGSAGEFLSAARYPAGITHYNLLYSSLSFYLCK